VERGDGTPSQACEVSQFAQGHNPLKRRRLRNDISLSSQHLGMLVACVACCLMVLQGPQGPAFGDKAQGDARKVHLPSPSPSVYSNPGSFRLMSIEGHTAGMGKPEVVLASSREGENGAGSSRNWAADTARALAWC